MNFAFNYERKTKLLKKIHIRNNPQGIYYKGIAKMQSLN
jgi:hypothetical protein